MGLFKESSFRFPYPLFPALNPSALFLGGGDSIMINADPSDWSQAWEDWRDVRINFRTPADQDGPTITARSTRRSIQHRWSASLISFLDHDGQQSKAVWAECSSLKGSGRWLDDPGGVFYGRHSFRSPIEYTMSLRMRL